MNPHYTKSLDALIAHKERRLKRARGHLAARMEKEARLKNHTMELNYHGGWDKGYWEGKVTELENTIDDLTELRDNLNHTQERES